MESTDDVRPKTNIVAWLVLALVIVMSFLIAYVIAKKVQRDSPYYAILLNNNQSFFGKLEYVDSNYITFSHVYLTNRVGTSTQFTKLSDTLVGPDDNLIISNHSIVYYEKLSPTSTVLSEIK